jgi:Tol biopolymer transport system component
VSDVFRRTLRNSEELPEREIVRISARGPSTGPAQNPAISRAGSAVVFEAIPTNRDFQYHVPLVYRWYLRSDGYGRAVTMSGDPQWHEPAYTFNGASVNPSISSRGNYVAFTSFGTGVFGESNGSAISDVFMRFIGVSFDGAPTY